MSRDPTPVIGERGPAPRGEWLLAVAVLVAVTADIHFIWPYSLVGLDEGAAAQEVAVDVIDLLEAVQVDKEESQGPASAHRALRFAAEGIVEVAGVVELGQVVGHQEGLGTGAPQGVGQGKRGRLDQERQGFGQLL